MQKKKKNCVTVVENFKNLKIFWQKVSESHKFKTSLFTAKLLVQEMKNIALES